MDGRLSGPNIKSSLINGLQAADVDVTDCGMIPTPLLYFATHSLDIPMALWLLEVIIPKIITDKNDNEWKSII